VNTPLRRSIKHIVAASLHKNKGECTEQTTNIKRRLTIDRQKEKHKHELNNYFATSYSPPYLQCRIESFHSVFAKIWPITYNGHSKR